MIIEFFDLINNEKIIPKIDLSNIILNLETANNNKNCFKLTAKYSLESQLTLNFSTIYNEVKKKEKLVLKILNKENVVCVQFNLKSINYSFELDTAKHICFEILEGTLYEL